MKNIIGGAVVSILLGSIALSILLFLEGNIHPTYNNIALYTVGRNDYPALYFAGLGFYLVGALLAAWYFIVDSKR